MKSSLFSFRVTVKAIAMISLLIMVSVIAVNSVKITKSNEQIQANQIETLTKVLISQAALSASDMVVQQDQEGLKQLANHLTENKLVFDATIYDSEGVKLAASDHALSVRDILGLDTPLATARIGRQQLVAPIYQDNSIIGFVRITFETGKLTAISDHFYRKSDRYMYSMVLMSFTAGALLMLLLLRNRRYKGENLLLRNVDSHREN